jgi:glycosyltransferase involved in cell wall biosynthesis
VCSGYSYIYGGVETVVSELSKRWAEHGNEVFILSGRGKMTGPPRVKLIKLPFLRSNIFSKIPLLRKIFPTSEFEALSLLPSVILCLMGLNPDIVLSNKLAETLPVEILNIPHVMFSQATMMSRFNAFKKADKIIVNDVRSYETLKKYPIKLEFFLNGVVNSRIREKNLNGSSRAKYGISNRSKVILTVARLDSNKRISLLIDAFKLIEQDFTLIIVGDGPELKSLVNQAALIRSKNKIIFVKPLPHEQLNEFYQLCDVFTLPSKLEAMPLVLIEALSFGKTVVTNYSPEKKFILGKYGIFTNVENAQEYSESLLLAPSKRVDVKSPDYLQHMQEFDWGSISLQYEEIFHNILQERHPRRNTR